MTRLLLALMFASAGVMVHATPQQLLADFQQIRLSSTSATTNFYMYSGLDADKRYEQRMEQSVKRLNDALNDADKLASNSQMTTEVAGLKAKSKQFVELLQANRDDIAKQGYPNVRLVDEMGRANNDLIALAASARDKLTETSGINANNVVRQTRELALLMERITSQYAARGTSNLGQVFVGNSEQSLNEMAEQFNQDLDKLAAAAKSPKSENILYSIQSKWRFMEERIRNYNENAVVFLVVSYNDRIIEHLQELEAMYL